MGLLTGGALAPGGYAVASDAPTTFDVQVTTTAANQSYSWQISAGTTINASTDWGDGTTETHTSVGIYTKTYAAAGVYTVKIQASFGSGGAFNMRPNADRTRLTTLLSPIPGFNGLSVLTNLLANCSGLTGSIPVDFLRYVTATTNFNLCFNLATSLQIQPNIFGANPTQRFLNQSPNFSNMFRSTGTAVAQGTAPAMWNFDYGTGTPTTTGTFSLQSTASLNNYNDIPAGWL